jgi:lysozyme family protein
MILVFCQLAPKLEEDNPHMKSNFIRALALVRKSEGGNNDDPHDRGGRTSRGITQREYDAWRKLNGQPPRDVFLADDLEIDAIYHDQYWEPHCDLLPIGLDYLFFNESVLAGTHEATILLQRALGVAADGHIGVVTRGALAAADPATVVARFSDQKRSFYQAIVAHDPTQKKWLAGWLNRADQSAHAAYEMISQPQPPSAVTAKPGD